MMSLGEALTDDYLVKLLEEDAKAVSARTSRFGFGGVSKRYSHCLPNCSDIATDIPRPGEKPKPNTRFLKNILRDTDNHNAALLAKEAEEAQARLERLKEKEKSSRARPEQQLYSARSRRENGGEPLSKRRRVSEDGGRDGERKRSARDGGSDRRRHRDRGGSQDEEATTRLRGKHGRDGTRHETSSREQKTERRRHNDRRSASPQRSPTRSHRQRDRTPEVRTTTQQFASKRRHRSPSTDSSDPLESIIGPAPAPKSPVHSRGRGAFTSARSTMDSHFSSTYDPATDIEPDVVKDGDDWDQALEALRDRAKWQKQGADRLRAAGFKEEEIRKWETGASGKGTATGDGDETDVRWKKAGEGREWDKGKVIGDGEDEDGSVGPSKGRLKRT